MICQVVSATFRKEVGGAYSFVVLNIFTIDHVSRSETEHGGGTQHLCFDLWRRERMAMNLSLVRSRGETKAFMGMKPGSLFGGNLGAWMSLVLSVLETV